MTRRHDGAEHRGVKTMTAQRGVSRDKRTSTPSADRSPRRRKAGPDKAIGCARSQVALACQDYERWAQSDLDEVRNLVAAARRSETDRGELLRAIYRGLAQMRAQGTACGYPLVTRIADLLCGFLRSVKETDQRQFALCDVHIDAIQSVLSERIHDEDGPLAQALLADLGRAEARLSS